MRSVCWHKSTRSLLDVKGMVVTKVPTLSLEVSVEMGQHLGSNAEILNDVHVMGVPFDGTELRVLRVALVMIKDLYGTTCPPSMFDL